MPAGSAITKFVSVLTAVASVSALHATGRAAIARRDAPINEARNNGAQFYLADHYESNNFFDGFDYFSNSDPTHGLVEYVGRDEAVSRNLTFVNQQGQAVVRIDKDTYLQPGEFRKSVRLESKKLYGNSMVVMDLAAMPHGCSVWPAFWMLSGKKQWPTGGEIDIIEGVNEPGSNAMTLHTSPGCTLDVSETSRSIFSGKVSATNCDANVNGNAGCGITDPDPMSYGHEFNVNGGGVFVTLIDDAGVHIWRFGRNEIPADLASGNPNPSSWAQPKAFWSANKCSRDFIDDKQQIVINITTCGDWAGSVFNQMGCAGSCAETVRDPNNFKWARFEINSLKVYKHT